MKKMSYLQCWYKKQQQSFKWGYIWSAFTFYKCKTLINKQANTDEKLFFNSKLYNNDNNTFKTTPFFSFANTR